MFSSSCFFSFAGATPKASPALIAAMVNNFGVFMVILFSTDWSQKVFEVRLSLKWENFSFARLRPTKGIRYFAAARRIPRKTKSAPAVRLSHCEIVSLLRNRSLKAEANQARTRHQIVPVV